jgi:CRP/FNR family transcriptional regulator/CRP/FNR family cyclic AMP-dependent transcriptional regulator
MLSGSTLFLGLSEENVVALAALCETRSYRHGDILFRQGDPGDSLHIVIEGQLKVYVAAESGDEILVAILGPGDCVGELSLIDGEPRSATVESISTTRTIVVPRSEFQRAIHANTQMMEALVNTLADRLRQTTTLAADLAFLDLRGRLAKKLLDLAEEHGRATPRGAVEITVPLTQFDLAAMMGVTRESISKQIGWFEQVGAIERRGRRILIVDRELLRRRITY